MAQVRIDKPTKRGTLVNKSNGAIKRRKDITKQVPVYRSLKRCLRIPGFCKRVTFALSWTLGRRSREDSFDSCGP